MQQERRRVRPTFSRRETRTSCAARTAARSTEDLSSSRLDPADVQEVCSAGMSSSSDTWESVQLTSALRAHKSTGSNVGCHVGMELEDITFEKWMKEPGRILTVEMRSSQNPKPRKYLGFAADVQTWATAS